MRIVLLLGALFVAATASAQEAPKVWTNADLAKPLPQLHRTVEPSVLAAMKARSEHIPFGAGGFASGGMEPSAPAPEGPVAAYYRAKAAAPREPRYYAAQPLYPWVVVYSGRRFTPYAQPLPSPRPAPGRRR